MQHVLAGFMFPLQGSFSKLIAQGTAAFFFFFFTGYLAHSSFKDFATANCFIEVLMKSSQAPSTRCQKCVFSGVKLAFLFCATG